MLLLMIIIIIILFCCCHLVVVLPLLLRQRQKQAHTKRGERAPQLKRIAQVEVKYNKANGTEGYRTTREERIQHTERPKRCKRKRQNGARECVSVLVMVLVVGSLPCAFLDRR